MEQRHITGKSHWYHETQSSTAEYDVLPLVPEAAKVSDPFLLDVILDEETLAPFLSWGASALHSDRLGSGLRLCTGRF